MSNIHLEWNFWAVLNNFKLLIDAWIFKNGLLLTFNKTWLENLNLFVVFTAININL